ncbi:hypothetical protein PoB_006980900 [Plakobranchus ocellatus]|uniref:Uncharacterized protein n=1 Tax=Plakobranchus ocellatus TaxID=259542 RepID=A0AAV4DGZ8_9GAST|nr:hypothetical protein PoB_006980900 [Plakobranchus ocellatus]
MDGHNSSQDKLELCVSLALGVDAPGGWGLYMAELSYEDPEEFPLSLRCLGQKNQRNLFKICGLTLSKADDACKQQRMQTSVEEL